MTRFAIGERVRVRDDYPPGHIRTPVYLRGKDGAIARYFGEFGNAEALAYGLKAPKKPVYKVRFRAAELWPDYKGAARDEIEADLYEHWLEKIA
jgi:nitrile hydratase subunit beta